MSEDLYPVGECTYYIKTRYAQLSNAMGNAVDWLVNAKRNGYQIIGQPAPDTVVVFKPGCYGTGSYRACYNKPDGHVAVVDHVYDDGTFLVSEMNYNGWNYIDQRRTTTAGVAGYFVPPGSSYVPSASGGQQSQGCITPGPGLLGIGCLDATIGGLVMGAGGLIMLAGVIVLVAASMKGTALGRASTGAIQTTGAPIRLALTARQQARTRRVQAADTERKQAEQARTHAHMETMRRAQVRTARARARAAESTARRPRVAA